MALVEVDDIEFGAPQPDKIHAFSIDAPRIGGRNVYDIELAGWVLGIDQPVQEIEIHQGGAVLRRAPLDRERPDVARDYPNSPGSADKRVSHLGERGRPRARGQSASTRGPRRWHKGAIGRHRATSSTGPVRVPATPATADAHHDGSCRYDMDNAPPLGAPGDRRPSLAPVRAAHGSLLVAHAQDPLGAEGSIPLSTGRSLPDQQAMGRLQPVLP